ncbi:hypothetical protein FOL47_007371 [Perkinsus chesapeaki]|uniref:DNL-type domain-containing protein n=1 Tax=Perkinsus chesapeaki TaxID=330153 RepID=A0A7J6LL02_PERCH|nr:hypothetical protein FOL47_007371 [Perkinsus chesapeaki]
MLSTTAIASSRLSIPTALSAARLLSSCQPSSVLPSRGTAPNFTAALATRFPYKGVSFFSTSTSPGESCTAASVPVGHVSSTGTIPISSLPGTKNDSAYALVFTCKKCGTRSAKKISKHSYHNGIVIVRCPGCEKLHLIADHFCWFGDEPQTIEDILREKGETVTKGTVDEAPKADQAVVAGAIADAVKDTGDMELQEGEVLPDIQIEGLDEESVKKLQFEILRRQRSKEQDAEPLRVISPEGICLVFLFALGSS